MMDDIYYIENMCFWNIIKINILFCVIRKIVFIFAAGNDKSHITMSEINQTINYMYLWTVC